VPAACFVLLHTAVLVIYIPIFENISNIGTSANLNDSSFLGVTPC
jgi:hypothetical protein